MLKLFKVINGKIGESDSELEVFNTPEAPLFIASQVAGAVGQKKRRILLFCSEQDKHNTRTNIMNNNISDAAWIAVLRSLTGESFKPLPKKDSQEYNEIKAKQAVFVAEWTDLSVNGYREMPVNGYQKMPYSDLRVHPRLYVHHPLYIHFTGYPP